MLATVRSIWYVLAIKHTAIASQQPAGNMPVGVWEDRLGSQGGTRLPSHLHCSCRRACTCMH